ncbi:MAG: CDP-alcohol phosphatidyltransferase family protein [Candidatus Tectimicrobiota bacterium]
MGESQRKALWYIGLLLTARALTLARLLSVPWFVWLLLRAPVASTALERASLPVLYVAIILSDFFDGRLARKAGRASHTWGQLDALADIVCTSCSLAAAAWLGRIGFWVPGGVALLGGRFLWRNLHRQPPSTVRLVEDRAGKAAGVIYYGLVGVITLELCARWEASQWYIARLGDAVALYTLWVLCGRRRGSRQA